MWQRTWSHRERRMVRVWASHHEPAWDVARRSRNRRRSESATRVTQLQESALCWRKAWQQEVLKQAALERALERLKRRLEYREAQLHASLDLSERVLAQRDEMRGQLAAARTVIEASRSTRSRSSGSPPVLESMEEVRVRECPYLARLDQVLQPSVPTPLPAVPKARALSSASTMTTWR